MKKKALLSSILTIALCLSMIAGSSFALFTSKSDVNVAVTSGKVDVVATATAPELGTTLSANLDETRATINEDSNVITLDKFVPGDYVTFNINITNNSDVTIKYRTVFTVVEDNGLWNGLKVTVGADTISGTVKKTAWTTLAPTDEVDAVAVKISLPEEAGNEYQEKTCKFAYTVEAVQGNAEMPDEWDGVATDIPAQTDGVYHITTAAEFVTYIKAVGAPTPHYVASHRFDTATVVLDRDIDLGGYTIERTGEPYAFTGKFDGQNHTVSNFTIKRTDSNRFTGLFGYAMAGASVKNLKVDNATVIGAKQTAVIVPAAYTGATVEKCQVSNSTIIGEKKVAPVVSYTESGAVKECSATNCDVYCQVNDTNEAGVVVGYINKEGGHANNTSDLTATNVNVYVGVSPVLVSNATELAAALANGGYVILTKDINANNAWTTVSIDNKNLTVLGKGHKITNLNRPLINFYGGTLTMKELTVADSIVTANGEGHEYLGAGIIAEQAQWANVWMDDCHVINSKITAGDTRTAAILGYWIGGGEIKNCSVENCEVSSADAAGGIVAHRAAQDGYETKAKITNCTVSNSNFTSSKEGISTWRVGTVIGTVTAGNAEVTGCTSTDNTVAQGTVTDPRHEVYGRVVDGGVLILNGTTYNS